MSRLKAAAQTLLAARFFAPYHLLWSHRELLCRVVETTLRQRHSGSMLGIGWLLLGPVLLMVTYAYMFIAVLGVRPPNLSVADYITHMACGLVLFLTITQSLMAATGALTQDPSLLFNKVFPAELFPVRDVLAAMPLICAGAIAAIAWAVVSGSMSWAWLWLPLMLLLLGMAIVGCAWVLSLANLITQDVAQVLGFTFTVVMLTSPIAFEIGMLPEQARFLVTVNPVAYFISGVQQVVVHGSAPGRGLVLGMALFALLSFHGGYALFMKGKSIIAESI